MKRYSPPCACFATLELQDVITASEPYAADAAWDTSAYQGYKNDIDWDLSPSQPWGNDIF